MKTSSRISWHPALLSVSLAAFLPLSGQDSSRTLPAADMGQILSTEKDLNLPPPPNRARGLPRGGTAPKQPSPVRERKEETLEGGYRMRGFRSSSRGGLPPALQGYVPETTQDLGPLAQGATSTEKQASSQAIANAANLVPVKPTVDASSQSRFNDIQFEIDTADFADTDKALAELAVIAAIMGRHPEARLLIRGHTCDLGDERYNLVLSCMRANKVWAWLVANNIHASRLDALGYGEQLPAQPLLLTGSAEHQDLARRANRRVFFQLQMPARTSS